MSETPLIDPKLIALGKTCIDLALAKTQRFAFVESCTGGLIGAAITANTGASLVFDGSIVPYSNAAKSRLVGSSSVFIEHGSVSIAAAVALALALLAQSDVDHVIASTGIAGPSGGTPAKPVGFMCLAAASRSGHRQSRAVYVDPDLDRSAIIIRCAEIVLVLLTQVLAAP